MHNTDDTHTTHIIARNTTQPQYTHRDITYSTTYNNTKHCTQNTAHFYTNPNL